MAAKPIAMFKTKRQITEAVTLGQLKVKPEVYENPDYRTAGMDEPLGLLVMEGSDYTAIDVKKVRDNPAAFMELAFGKIK